MKKITVAEVQGSSGTDRQFVRWPREAIVLLAVQRGASLNVWVEKWALCSANPFFVHHAILSCRFADCLCERLNTTEIHFWKMKIIRFAVSFGRFNRSSWFRLRQWWQSFATMMAKLCHYDGKALPLWWQSFAIIVAKSHRSIVIRFWKAAEKAQARRSRQILPWNHRNIAMMAKLCHHSGKALPS